VHDRHPEHPAFLTDRTDGDVDPADSQQLFLPGFLPAAFFCCGFAIAQDAAASGDVVSAVSVCEESEVPYAYKARGQNLKQEPSNKLVCLEHHGFLAIPICIITP
jgi:hypothetical protein